MSNDETKRRRRGARRRRHQAEAQKATREDIAALIARFENPNERRSVPDWPGFAHALAREARRYRLALPFWLARFAGYPESPAPLRVIEGGATPDLFIEDVTGHGGAIIVGLGSSNLIGKLKASLDAAARAKKTSTPPEDEPPPSTRKPT